ncbi:MAG: hypothetical protein HUK24_08110, partial [Sphaerochaetaceae bacterium]|nr:hypothetical protein [Sphaerochaetaceae bacterium]
TDSKTKAFIERKLIVNETQLEKDFSSISFPTAGGLDYSGKLLLIKNAIKDNNSLLQFELIDKIITVQPLEVLSSTEKTKLIKFIEFPLGEEKVLNIGVIYKVTSLY